MRREIRCLKVREEAREGRKSCGLIPVGVAVGMEEEEIARVSDIIRWCCRA